MQIATIAVPCAPPTRSNLTQHTHNAHPLGHRQGSFAGRHGPIGRKAGGEHPRVRQEHRALDRKGRCCSCPCSDCIMFAESIRAPISHSLLPGIESRTAASVCAPTPVLWHWTLNSSKFAFFAVYLQAIGGLPPTQVKRESARMLNSILRGQTSLNHLSQAGRQVLQDSKVRVCTLRPRSSVADGLTRKSG